MRTVAGLTVLAALLTLTGCSGPRPLHAIRSHADTLVTQGRYDEAIAEYEEYIARKPEDVQVRGKLGAAYLAAEQPLRAREQYLLAAGVQPFNDGFLDGLAESYYQANAREDLIEFLARQTRERGAVSDYIRQGKYLFKLGNADEARFALETAARLDKGRTIEPQIALADMYRDLGDRANEVRRLRMALFVNPNNQAVQERLTRVGSGPKDQIGLTPAETGE